MKSIQDGEEKDDNHATENTDLTVVSQSTNDDDETEGFDLDAEREANLGASGSEGAQRPGLSPRKKIRMEEGKQRPKQPPAGAGAVLNLSDVGVDDESLGRVRHQLVTKPCLILRAYVSHKECSEGQHVTPREDQRFHWSIGMNVKNPHVLLGPVLGFEETLRPPEGSRGCAGFAKIALASNFADRALKACCICDISTLLCLENIFAFPCFASLIAFQFVHIWTIPPDCDTLRGAVSFSIIFCKDQGHASPPYEHRSVVPLLASKR